MGTLGVDDGDQDLRFDAIARATATNPLADSESPLFVPTARALENTLGTFTSTQTAPTLTANHTTVWGDSDFVTGAGDVTFGAGDFTAGTGDVLFLNETLTVGTKADAKVWVGASSFADAEDGGLWVRTNVAGLLSRDRTAGTSNDFLSVDLTAIFRALATKGVQIDSVEVVYAITVAPVDTALNINIIETTLNGNTNIPTIASHGGADIDFDALHDTFAERAIVGEHTALLTVPTPSFQADSVGRSLLFEIDDAGTAVVKFYGALFNLTLALD